MTLEELEAISKQGVGGAFVMFRDTRPQGYRVRTPFGLSEIINVQEKNATEGKYQICYRASQKELIELIEKVKKYDL